MSDPRDFKGPWKWHEEDGYRPEIYLEDATGDAILYANADYTTMDAWIEASPEVKRFLAVAPEMYEFVKLCADGGNPHARAIVAKALGEAPVADDYIEDIECPGLTCDGKKAEATHTFSGGTKYRCLTCGFHWEEPSY